MHIIDQVNDPAHSRLRIIAEEYPDLIAMTKTANFSVDEFESLPDEAYAWPGKRLYPIHTKEHAAISYAFSKIAQVKIPSDVRYNLDKALEVYAVDPAVYSRGQRKTASAPTYYVLPEQQRFKIACAEDVARVDTALNNKHRQLSLGDRTTAADRLYKAAQHYGVSVATKTAQMAGQTLTHTLGLRDNVHAREEAAAKLGSAVSEAYKTLADELTNTEQYISDRSYQLKIAQMLTVMDKTAGLIPQYGRTIQDPMLTVFNTQNATDSLTKVGAALHDTQLMASLPLSFWEDALGPDVANEIAPAGVVDPALLNAVLPTLPADLKKTLNIQLKAYKK